MSAAATFWPACGTLWRREIVRFLRQRGRIAGALGTPVVFWIIAGAGLSGSFHLPGGGEAVSYLHYSFPGALAAVLLFTAVFSTMSIIDDRREGFLQAVMTAPCPRSAVVLGKVLGATTLGLAQALLLMTLGPLSGLRLAWWSWPATVGAMVLIALAMTNLGFWLAWRMESTQGFHAIMNLLLMPMLVLSGAFFPMAGAAGWMEWIMRVNPLTYGVGLMRSTMGATVPAGDAIGVGTELAVTALFAGITFSAALRRASRGMSRMVS